jgi:hypothetical protein
MKKKDYKKPVCLVVAIPHIAVSPLVSSSRNTGEALSREQRLWRYDDEEEY